MKNAEIYAYIANFNDTTNIILIISFIFIIIYSFINVLIKYKNGLKIENIVLKNDVKIRKNVTIIDILGAITLVVKLIYFLFYLFKIDKLISILSIPSTILIIYIVYVRPMIKLYNEPFKYNYTMYGLVLLVSIWINSKIDYIEYFRQSDSDSLSQVILIIIVLIQLYTTLYCLLVNLYFLLKSITYLNINKIKKYFLNIVKCLDERFLYDNIDFSYKYSNSLIQNNYNKLLKKYY